MLSFLVLCPPSILSVAIREPEIGTNSFYILWGSIGVLNAALYALIRLLVARRLQRRGAD